MKCKLYGASLIVFVSVMVTFVLRTYLPITTAKKAVAATAAKITAGGTPVSIRYRDRAHSPILANANQESQDAIG